jgi:hypothetical protein
MNILLLFPSGTNHNRLSGTIATDVVNPEIRAKLQRDSGNLGFRPFIALEAGGLV